MAPSVVVFVMCSSAAEARRIAHSVVGSRLAACANLLPGSVESVYRWKGRVERAKERLLLVKTTRRKFPALRDAIRRLHSYDVPEIIALPIIAGLPAYLAWIEDSVRRRSN
ncbi:MAG: divalent-cation tolerance protein CutA [Candidatus Acidiferrales bacterium]